MKTHKDGTVPTNGEIFVFGSNTAGRHGAGAALVAVEKFGAIYGKGWGLQGQSFAIPTKSHTINTLPLSTIAAYVTRFKAYVLTRPDATFFITSIGCGLAGYTNEAIAPMFRGIADNVSVPRNWEKLIVTVDKGRTTIH
jgi:hypothetical protein